MRIEALIFDVDGTLAETEELHLRAFNEAFSHFGLGWCWSASCYRRLLAITGGKERIKAFQDEIGVQDLSAQDIAALHAVKTARYEALVRTAGVRLRPGCVDLLSDAKARGLKVAIATTTTLANVDALCRVTIGKPAIDIFDAVAAGDDVARKKPAPDIYLLALRRLNAAPQHCIAFEDSGAGVAAARAAGVYVVASPSCFTSAAELCNADQVLQSFADYRLP
jgi:beta-phosphoglucomutase-like phosphatase (HAD superfamily)